MFAEQHALTERNVISEACGEILEDILKSTFESEYCLKKVTTESRSEFDKNYLKEGKSLCNCTQTGEVKILVKKITDLENELQKPTRNKTWVESNTILISKNDITTDTDNDFNDELEDNVNKVNENQLEFKEKHIPTEQCNQNVSRICHISAADVVEANLVVLDGQQQCKCQNKNVDDAYTCQDDKSVKRQEVICESDVAATVCQISKDNIEEMSDFLVKACEMRQLRRLSLQEPQVMPEDYEIDEMSDPFASILEQGDHIMDTFHNLLTDNGNLTVRISFSYCAKLLAVLLTLNTIFFSKIIIWDSFLQYLF